jgi:hypothetical protein
VEWEQAVAFPNAGQSHENGREAALSGTDEKIPHNPCSGHLHDAFAHRADLAIELWEASADGVEVGKADGERLARLDRLKAHDARPVREHRSGAEPRARSNEVTHGGLVPRSHDDPEGASHDPEHAARRVAHMVGEVARPELAKLAIGQEFVLQRVGHAARKPLPRNSSLAAFSPN